MKKLFLLPLAFATLLLSCNGGSKPAADDGKCCSASDLTLNVMSYNIRYDNPDDSLNNWQYRKDYAAKHFFFYDVDVAGTQEVLHNQLQDLQASLPTYATIGVGRLDGKTEGEYSAILYKKDRFDVVKSGNFWLSEDTEAVGQKGWDAACERIVTWAVFKDKATAKEFCFINTHFDHVGKVARRESSKLLLSKAKELSGGLPIIATGDYNAEPETEVVQTITDKNNPDHFTDSRSVSPIVYGPSGSFHAFGRIPYERRSIIDYIFIKGDVKVKRHGILSEKQDAVYASDHHPVLATVIVGK